MKITLGQGPFLTLILVLHIAAGFIGMYGGLVPLLVRKGGASHRRWGRVFTWAMLAASATAFPLAWVRQDSLQAGVGLLAGYGALLGIRSVRRGRSGNPSLLDSGLAVVSLLGFAALASFGDVLVARCSAESASSSRGETSWRCAPRTSRRGGG